MRSEDLVTRQLEARLRAADARLDVMQAQAEARQDRDALAEVFSLRTASEGARWRLAGLKDLPIADRARARRLADAALRQLECAITQALGQQTRRNAAGRRHLHASLAEAEAKLRLWRARKAVEAADHELELHEVAVTVQVGSALAKARDAELQRERYERKAQEAGEEAAWHLGEAIDAAAQNVSR